MKSTKQKIEIDTKKMLTFKGQSFHRIMGLAAMSLAFAFLICPQMVFAAGGGGAASVTSSFNTLKEIVVALVTSVGTIVLLWGFFEWGTSLQSQEGVMQANAFKRIGGGLVMVLAPQLINAFV